jgi:type IV pilus modification protein PilV
MKSPIDKQQLTPSGRRSRARNQQGFTLIETAVALVIMMIAGLAVAALFSYAINYNAGAYDRTLAQSLAQQRMEQMRMAPYEAIISSAESDVTMAEHHFSVATTVNTTSALKTITIQVTPTRTAPTWARTPVVVTTQRASTSLGVYF